MLIKFKKIIGLLIMCFFIFPPFVFSTSHINEVGGASITPGFLYEWDYGIVEDDPFKNSTEFFVDKDKTTLTIDHTKKEIRLHRENAGNPISFIDDDNIPVAYSVMTETCIKQFAYDGTEMVEVGFLEIEVENPLAMATKQSSPDIIVAHKPVFDAGDGDDIQQDEGSDYKIEYYGFDGFEMVNVPFLEITGLKEIKSMAFLKDEITAVLTEEALNVYGFDGDGMTEMPILKIDEIENPLDFASDGEYSISLLTENNIKQFAFAGNGLVEIPGLSILLDTIDDVGKPRFIASVENRITFIDEHKAYTFLQGADEMHYVQALSVTEGLVDPKGLSIHRNSHDLIILDQSDDEDGAVIRYYMFDGTSLIEIPELSLELKDVILGTGGKYSPEGVLVSKPLEIEKNYVDLFQVGIYPYLEEGTSIKLFMANGYEIEIEADDENSWKPIWILEKRKGEDGPVIYKNYGGNSLEDWGIYEGEINKIYPVNLDMNTDTDLGLEDYEIVEGEDGELYLKPEKENKNNKWFKFEMPVEDIDLSKDSYIRFKMEFYSEEGSKTPKVFVPSVINEIDGIEDDTAIKILARKKTLIPIIDDIDPGVPSDDDLPEPPDSDDTFPEFPGPIVKEGWVYTTTPTITWTIPTLDHRDEDNPENNIDDNTYQTAYELVLMAITDDGYKAVFSSGKIVATDNKPIEITRNSTIPTSNSPDVEGPMFASGSYRFATFIRIWDPDGNPSEFSVGRTFNVLAFERPRIERIESTPDGLMNTPFMIQKDMTIDELLKAKAGTAITFLIDVVGPIENDLELNEDVSIIYYTDTEEKSFVMEKGFEGYIPIENPVNKRISIISWTPAPMIKNVEGSIVKTYLYGDSSEGGRTIFAVPNYAEGIAEISSTVYKDWEVFLDGRD